MPRYFFHTLNGDLFKADSKGKTLPGDDAAFEYAVIELQQLLRTPVGQQLNPGRYSVQVTNETGRPIFEVPLDLPIVQGWAVEKHSPAAEIVTASSRSIVWVSATKRQRGCARPASGGHAMVGASRRFHQAQVIVQRRTRLSPSVASNQAGHLPAAINRRFGSMVEAPSSPARAPVARGQTG